MSTATAADELTAVHPDRLAYRGKEIRVGSVSYALVTAVLAMGGRAPVKKLAVTVWGKADLPRGTVDRRCSWLSKKLADELGYPGRLGVDRGDVVLYR